VTAPLEPRGAVELDDVQGLVRFGYKHLTEAVYLLLRVKDRDAAREWLRAAPVTSAVTADPPPQTALQIALTSEGMRALEVPPEIVEGFSAEFIAGMAGDASRSRRLGDLDASAPGGWDWGTAPSMPHVLIMLYAAPGMLEAWQSSVLEQCEPGFEVQASLGTSDLDGVEPFGFVDGISQPRLDWERRRSAGGEARLEYDNLTCLGEFLLGYPNEYGRYTDRPLLEAGADAQGILPRAEEAPDKADVGRNGSYLVMRQLRQDVQGFWQFLDRQAEGDAAARERWAEGMVGRTRRGEPLARRGATGAAAAGASADLNDFRYDHDPHGVLCPLGAHVRRSNPRNADLPPGKPGLLSKLIRELGLDAAALEKDLVASTRFHRLLRRGREYGPNVSVAEAVAGSATAAETGLHFICLGANIARQFEFVQSAWIMGTKFDGLKSEGDGLLGHREPGPDAVASDVFSMPRADGPDERLCGLPRFVAVRGGAYFFLPGIRALRYLVSGPRGT
jgi:deferrochelatase/peroxidase EfeB